MSTQNHYSAPFPHPDLQALWRLEEVEKRLAQDFGLDSDQGIDSEAVLQEAIKRDASEGYLRKASLVFIRMATGSENSVDALKKLDGIRRDLATTARDFKSVSQLSTAATPYHTSRFWAVLIGIDAYRSNPLRGCVSDALAMRKILIEKLDVPECRIQCLLGSNNPTSHNYMPPSRANIVKMLYSLIYNSQIQRGDNLIIYYAGHGSIYDCSGQCTATGSTCRTAGICPIEALCPIDRDTMDADGCWIPDISDRELNALFRQISYAKGNKITFIADCCYAGGMTRGLPEPGVRAMSSTSHSSVNDMLCAAHNKLKYLPRYDSVLSQDWQPDLSSHVSVAACQDHQTAKESGGGNKWGGEFTRKLIDVLKSGECKKETTYVELTHRLNRTHFQTPVAYGDHKNKSLWYLDTVA